MNYGPDPSACIILSIADNKVSKNIVDPIKVIRLGWFKICQAIQIGFKNNKIMKAEQFWNKLLPQHLYTSQACHNHSGTT